MGDETDATVDGRLDVGVAEILLRDGQGGLALENAGLGAVERGAVLIERCLRHGLVSGQFRAAIERQLRVELLCLGRGEIGLGLVDARLVLRFLDLIEQVAGFDILAFREEHLLEEALDPRAQLHRIDGFDATDERIGAGDAFHFCRPDADGGRRRRRRGLRLRLVSASGEQGDEEGCRKKARWLRPVRVPAARRRIGSPNVRDMDSNMERGLPLCEFRKRSTVLTLPRRFRTHMPYRPIAKRKAATVQASSRPAARGRLVSSAARRRNDRSEP